VLVAQVPALVASRALGLAAVGAITLATNISMFATRVDDIVTQTLYPAICAVKDRTDKLFESFAKSNRLALLWGVPCGVAAALFADDFVRLVLGEEKWGNAVVLIQVLGLAAAVNQIGFNWSAYFRARGETRPIAVANATQLVLVLAVAVPLLVSHGVDGFAAGMAVATAGWVIVRMVYVARLFRLTRVGAHVARAIAPTVPAAGVVLAARALDGDASRGPARVIAEAVVFSLLVVAFSWVSERRLLLEALGYLRRRPAAAPAGLPS
jgi:O-antigen/teichoic acid export membrane protein